MARHTCEVALLESGTFSVVTQCSLPMIKLSFQRSHDFFRKRSVQRILIGLATFLLLFTVFGYAILPGIIKSRLERTVAEKLHRPLTVGAVEVQPFAMVLTL